MLLAYLPIAVTVIGTIVCLNSTTNSTLELPKDEIESNYSKNQSILCQQEHLEESFDALILCLCTQIQMTQEGRRLLSSGLDPDLSTRCPHAAQLELELEKEEQNAITIDEHRVKRQSAKVQLPVSQALNWVQMFTLEPCAGRIVCELSCDSTSLGAEGNTLYDNLFFHYEARNFKSLTPDQMAYYELAHKRGLILATRASSCKRCYDLYTPCARTSVSLVKIASQFDLIP